jgi:hypothetical protein
VWNRADCIEHYDDVLFDLDADCLDPPLVRTRNNVSPVAYQQTIIPTQLMPTWENLNKYVNAYPGADKLEIESRMD